MNNPRMSLDSSIDNLQMCTDFPIACFPYLNCLQKSKKNLLDGSLLFFAARPFRFHDFSFFGGVVGYSHRHRFSGGKPPEATAKTTRGSLCFSWERT